MSFSLLPVFAVASKKCFVTVSLLFFLFLFTEAHIFVNKEEKEEKKEEE